jgi:hypothetical protein
MCAREASEFRVEKQRASATLTLSSGATASGHFFLAQASATLRGPERVAELLNSESGFFPFEDDGGQTMMFNRDHLVCAQLSNAEAALDAGYTVAPSQRVSISLSTGRKLVGVVHIYRPEGRHRLSDWARHGTRFRYLERPDETFIVNVDHIVAVHEAPDR